MTPPPTGPKPRPSPVEPDPLVHFDGTPVKSAEDWWKSRRPEILEAYRRFVYGRTPEHARPQRVEASEESVVLNGQALRRSVSLRYGTAPDQTLELLVHLPASKPEPTAVFVGLNFFGNAASYADPSLPLEDRWMRADHKLGVVDHRLTEKTRGRLAHRWPLERILERGYGLVTAYYGDLDPDHDDGFRNGVHGVFDPTASGAAAKARANDAWGSISAWAEGLRWAVDWCIEDSSIDDRRVAVIGHSRLGKAALWAAAQDPHIAMVVSNESGCGGAANFRRRHGETIRAINERFPHWFCRQFHDFADREHELPVDQHLLLALVAPRPVYVASAIEDDWADPEGEFLSVLGAHPVYALLGRDGYPQSTMPPVDEPVHGTLGYHVRSGAHDLTPPDWEQFLDFADRHFG